jgi:hypothetical protein
MSVYGPGCIYIWTYCHPPPGELYMDEPMIRYFIR